jgi:hypothetical protein
MTDFAYGFSESENKIAGETMNEWIFLWIQWVREL